MLPQNTIQAKAPRFDLYEAVWLHWDDGGPPRSEPGQLRRQQLEGSL